MSTILVADQVSIIANMESALESSDHTITLPDGTTQIYHLRSLTEDDIQRWSELCTSVFSYKPNPPPSSYFARHYHNDPRRDASLIRVLLHCPNDTMEESENGEIVSSVRIFRRTLSAPGQYRTIEAGGIGEVCTSANHQRRGLSKLLLKDALNIMSTSCKSDKDNGMECSLLHANPDFRPVYNKVGGYECVKSEWSVVPIHLKHLSTINTFHARSDGWALRQADFPQGYYQQDIEQLHCIHKSYSEKRFITVKRSKEYWKEYVSAELGDTLWVLAHPDFDDCEFTEVKAWMSIRKRGDRYQLREFGYDTLSHNEDYNEDYDISVSSCFRHLLGVALEQAGESVGVKKKVELVLPTFILSDIKEECDKTGESTPSYMNIKEATEENDNGWMYVNFSDDSSRQSILELTTRESSPLPHLIWPTDSF